MERARVRGAVTEERDRDARLALQLEGERRTGHHRQPAADDRVRAQVALRDVVEVHRAAEAAGASLLLAVHLGHDRVDRRALGDGVGVRAVSGRDHVVRLERGAHAGSHGLLPDRDMEEARQLTGSEALLDLLLESPDHEHLAEELAQSLIREVPRGHALLSVHLSHAGHYADGR